MEILKQDSYGLNDPMEPDCNLYHVKIEARKLDKFYMITTYVMVGHDDWCISELYQMNVRTKKEVVKLYNLVKRNLITYMRKMAKEYEGNEEDLREKFISYCKDMRYDFEAEFCG